MADELGFDIVAHGHYSSEFDKAARKAQETALKIEAANLKVEKATKKATDADAKYEKGSLQSRDAANRLSVAQLNLSKAMSASAANVDNTRAKVDKLDVSEKKLSTTTKKTDTDHNRLSNTMKKLGNAIGSAALSAAKGVGTIAALSSVAVTGGIAIAKMAIATAHLAVATGPALAGLLPLAAGALLIKKTLVAAGPAMLKAISPLTDAWKKQTVEVGKLASAGLRPLAREFVKTNFPQIGAAMNSIATTANAAVTSFVKWADSAPGVKAIGQVVAGTAHMFERLAPAAVKVADSIVSLAGRASGVTFNAFSDGAGAALRKFSKFLDGISATDVHDAFDKIGSLARSAGKGFEALGDGLAWAEAHMKVINEIRTAVAVLSIVIGVATGGWLIALGGAITLVVMNWGHLTDAFKTASAWISNLGQKFPSLTGPIDAAKGAVQDIKGAFSQFLDDVGPHVQPFIDKVGDAFIRLQPTISGIVSIVGGAIKVFLQFAGPLAGTILDAIGFIIDAFSRVTEFVTFAIAGILDALAKMFQPIASLAKKLHLPFANAFQGMVDDAKNASKRMTDNIAKTKVDLAVREMERLQRKVNTLKGKKVKTEADKAAIRDSERQIREFQRQINAMHGKNLTIGINTVRTTSGSTAPGARGTWMGGPIIGPGTGTSDSILTRLSNGEHVISAAEVKKLGGHAAIQALRKGQAPVRASAAAPAGFRSGGSASVTVLRIESGGSNMDDLLVQILRKAVRVKGGGNVQVALGRN